MGRKKALKLKDAQPLAAPHFPEFKASFAMSQCALDETIVKYVPAKWFKPRARVDRDYLWTLLATF